MTLLVGIGWFRKRLHRVGSRPKTSNWKRTSTWGTLWTIIKCTAYGGKVWNKRAHPTRNDAMFLQFDYSYNVIYTELKMIMGRCVTPDRVPTNIFFPLVDVSAIASPHFSPLSLSFPPTHLFSVCSAFLPFQWTLWNVLASL